MPSTLHEAPLVALREFPELLLHLVRNQLEKPLPESARVREQPNHFSAPTIEEHRADAVFLIEDKSQQVLAAVIVEVQRRPDEDKPYRWLRYAARVHDDYRCDTYLLVIATDESTARWAQRPIHSFLPGRGAVGNAPVVLSPASLPKMRSVDEARQKLGQAILTALLHAGADGDIQGAYQALRALHEQSETPEAALERIWWLLGLFGGILTEERFTELETLIMINPEMKFVPRTEFERQPYYRGKVESKAEAIVAVLKARGFAISERIHSQISGCQDLAVLDRWLVQAATALSEADITTP